MQETQPEKETLNYFTPVNAGIVAINILVFLLVDRFRGDSGYTERMLEYGAMYWPYVKEDGQFYRLFTSMFLHFGITHLFNNMLILWFLGSYLERLIGNTSISARPKFSSSLKYLFLYLLSGVLAGLFSMEYNMVKGEIFVAAGASGAIFGVSGALLYIVLINRGHVEGLTIRQIILFVFLSMYAGFASSGVDNAAHVGGFLSGFVLAVLIYRRPKKERY